MLRLLTATYVLSALSCSVAASQPASAADHESQLIGTFLSNDFDFSQSLKIRTPKHTLTEYRYQVLDYSKLTAVALTLHGTWALKGRRYCETITQSSYPAWQSLVGRTRCHDIVTLTPSLLQYFSRDSAPIRERKLIEEDAAPLLRDPFSFVSNPVRQKYGFERH